jgi:hypothetical protein
MLRKRITQSESISTDELKTSVEKTEQRRDWEPQVKKIRSGALFYSWNGLDLDCERYSILSRDDLVEKLRSNLYKSRFVMLCSPPATGKTALCQILVNKYQFAHKLISCRTGKIPSDELEDVELRGRFELGNWNFKNKDLKPVNHKIIAKILNIKVFKNFLKQNMLMEKNKLLFEKLLMIMV